MTRPPRGIRPAIWLFVALVVLVYSDPLFVRKNFGARDLLAYYLPTEKAVHDAYARGRWPVWLEGASGGRPLLANINVGALYPAWPLLSPLPFPLAMRIYPVMHWALAGIGIILLLSTTGLSKSAAALGAVTYVFSGVSVSESVYTNHHPGVTLLPWILWSVARPAKPLGRVLTTSILLALDFLAGDVFTITLALGSAILWIALERERGARFADFKALAVSLSLAVLLALPQLVATLLWIPESRRATTGMKLGEALHTAVRPWRLLEFVVPYPFGPTGAGEPQATWARPVFGGFAMGFFPTLYMGSFAVCAAIVCWKRAGRGLVFSRALLLATLAICVLPTFVPTSWSNWRAPIPLRYPEKMAVGVSLAGALLAGLGFDALRGDRRSRRWPIAVGSLLALAAAAAAALPAASGRIAAAVVGAPLSSASLAAIQMPRALSEAGLLWMSAVIALDLLRLPGRAPIAVALALAALTPVAANRRIAKSSRESELFSSPPFTRLLDRRDPKHAYRSLGESLYLPTSDLEGPLLRSGSGLLDFARQNWFFFTPILWGRGLVFNYDLDEGDLSRVESLRRFSYMATRLPHPEAFFGSLALRFGSRFRDQGPLPGFGRIGGAGPWAWDENAQASPDLRLLERWREEPGALAALSDIPALTTGEVALETGESARRSARAGEVKVLEKSPEILRLETDALDPTFLFVLRGFWSYRDVAIDRRPVPVFPAQLAFSAIPVPAGHHRIDWTENVPGGHFSRWGPAAYALLIAAFGFLVRSSARKR